MFDAITPAVVAANLTVGYLLDDARAARLVEQHALDPTLPGLDNVIDRLIASTFGAEQRQRVRSGDCARRPARRRRAPDDAGGRRGHAAGARDRDAEAAAAPAALCRARRRPPASAHASLLAADIKRFLDRPFAPATRTELPTPPPGAPIGDPGMDWLGTLAPLCSWDK